ncbi:MAG: hypothetical protein ABII00_00995 [Elusimicrobiota bacterium]
MTGRLWKRFLDLFSDEEDPAEPVYDPAQLGGAVIVSLVGIGCAYWLLWTLLVYEGGLFMKLGAAAQVVFTSKTLKDVGYEGSPYAMGPFEGWFGNLAALLLCVAVVFALHRLHQAAARRPRAGK